MLRADELEFLSSSLGIQSSLVKKLTEQESDTNLLLEQVVAIRDFKKEDVLLFSSEIGFKLILFKYTQSDIFPINEKLYIVKAVRDLYKGLIAGIKDNVTDRLLLAYEQKKPSEETSKTFLVASGLLNTRLKYDFTSRKHIFFIENGFWVMNNEFAKRATDWLIVLRKIQNDGWLLNNSAAQNLKLLKEGVILGK